MTNISRRRCIFTSAGDRHNLDQWLEADGRSWDLIVAYYGDDDTQRSRLESASDVFFSRKGSKFQNLLALFSRDPDILKRYDFIWVMDDDLIVPPYQIEAMFEIAERWDLWVCQPSFDPAGKITLDITAHNASTFLRIVDFVEVTCPLFRADKLFEFLGHYDGSLVGWGIDYWYGHVLQSRVFRKFCIVDVVKALNPTDEAKDGMREIDTLQPAAQRKQHAEEVLGKLGIVMEKPAEIAWAMNPIDAKSLASRVSWRDLFRPKRN